MIPLGAPFARKCRKNNQRRKRIAVDVGASNLVGQRLTLVSALPIDGVGELQ
jgi:hypothetical protein